MSEIYPNEATASKKSREGAPGSLAAVKKLAESKYGLEHDHKLTIHILDKMLTDAEKAGNIKKIQQLKAAKSSVRKSRHRKKHKAHAAVASVLGSLGIAHVIIAGADGLDDHLARTDRFETHKPVTVTYLHNDTSAPYMGSRFGQDIEPTGFYFTEKEGNRPVPDGLSSGVEEIKNPLVLHWGSGYGQSDCWKNVLARVFECTGAQLSKLLMAKGFTHIITIDESRGVSYPSEMVRLAYKRTR